MATCMKNKKNQSDFKYLVYVIKPRPLIEKKATSKPQVFQRYFYMLILINFMKPPVSLYVSEKMRVKTLLALDQWRCSTGRYVNAHNNFGVTSELSWNWTR